MKVILKSDEAVAKVWDDYLHRFGAEEYVVARYLTPRTTMPLDEDALDIPTALTESRLTARLVPRPTRHIPTP